MLLPKKYPKMLDLTNKKITILGARRSGLALAKLVLQLKGNPRISDCGSEESSSKDTREWICKHNIPIEWGQHSKEFISESDYIVLSPAVPYGSSVVQWAKKEEIPVLGEIEFAFQFCRGKIIAVTGSNGKTTVVTLLRDVLHKAGCPVALCGNIGYPFSECVLDSKDDSYTVLEVSSFQLESILGEDNCKRIENVERYHGIKGFKPHIAVLLNLSSNHLDRHKDIDDYRQAKQRIFLNQEANDYAVLPSDEAPWIELASAIKANVIYSKSSNDAEADAENPNYRAVKKVAKILNISSSTCDEVFSSFRGIEHRLEWIRNLDGVEFINDSKSTTAEATRWALSRIPQPILIICGGRDKNIDMTVLRDRMGQKVKVMYVIGEAREKITKIFSSVMPVVECDSLEAAVTQARGQAVEGDCILLSPMCASFDMFRNYEHRGEVFKHIVNGLVSSGDL